MNEKLKTIESIAQLLYSEIQSCVNSNELDDKAYKFLKEAMFEVVNTKRKIEIARSWVITADRKSK